MKIRKERKKAAVTAVIAILGSVWLTIQTLTDQPRLMVQQRRQLQSKDNRRTRIVNPPLINCQSYIQTAESGRNSLKFQRTNRESQEWYDDSHERTLFAAWQEPSYGFQLELSPKELQFVRQEVQSTAYIRHAGSTTLQNILRQQQPQHQQIKQEDYSNQETKYMMVDVGGHMGWFSFLAAFAGYPVMVFEEDPQQILRICRNIQLNKASKMIKPNQIQVYHAVLIDHPDSSSISLSLDVSGRLGKGAFGHQVEFVPQSPIYRRSNKAIMQEPNGIRIPVTVTSLDEVWMQHQEEWDHKVQILVLKIDIMPERQAEVVQGAKQWLQSTRNMIHNILMDLEVTATNEDAIRSLIETLNESNFELRNKWKRKASEPVALRDSNEVWNVVSNYCTTLLNGCFLWWQKTQ